MGGTVGKQPEERASLGLRAALVLPIHRQTTNRTPGEAHDILLMPVQGAMGTTNTEAMEQGRLNITARKYLPKFAPQISISSSHLDSTSSSQALIKRRRQQGCQAVCQLPQWPLGSCVYLWST